jgi:N-acyl-D-aspartate/D-glutamate deacylase
MVEFREEIKEKIWAGKWYRLNPNITPNWAGTQRIMECKDGRFVDKTVAEIAEELGKNELDVLMDVLMVDPYAKVGTRGFDNPTKGMFYKHPASMVGIDTFAIDTDWETKHPPWYRPSENSFGGFAAYFMNAVRESKFLSVEEAVRKVTSLPAEKFKLSDRGVLKPGAYADIVVMDLEKVTPKAGPLTPNVYPEGIEHVVVNGIHVVRDSEHTGARPGKVLYRE